MLTCVVTDARFDRRHSGTHCAEAVMGNVVSGSMSPRLRCTTNVVHRNSPCRRAATCYGTKLKSASVTLATATAFSVILPAIVPLAFLTVTSVLTLLRPLA